MVLDLDGDGGLDPQFLLGHPLAGTALTSVQTLGQRGLLALVLSLVALGLRTLRVG